MNKKKNDIKLEKTNGVPSGKTKEVMAKKTNGVQKSNGAMVKKTNGMHKANDHAAQKTNDVQKSNGEKSSKNNGLHKSNGVAATKTNGVQKTNGLQKSKDATSKKTNGVMSTSSGAIRKTNGEIWKQIQFPGHKKLRKKYAVSNEGRAASYTAGIYEDGKVLNGSLTSGYRTLNLHLEDGNGTIYLHREVARLFCPKKSPKAKFVIHKNHVKTDNKFKNLQWSTAEEVSVHQQKSPEKIAYKERQANRTEGLKLNATQVRRIKKEIANPKRKLTYKQMAEKYGVSEMTLYRIKSGENWSRVT